MHGVFLFTIICILPDSQFTGVVEEVETENDYSFQRVTSVYGRGGLLVYPKKCWKRTEDIIMIEPSIDKYPGDETN